MKLLDEIEALREKATPGPYYGRESLLTNSIMVHGEGQIVVGALNGGDAEYIVALANGFPAIRDEMKSLEKERSDAKFLKYLLVAGVEEWAGYRLAKKAFELEKE